MGESAIGLDVTVKYNGEIKTKTGFDTNLVFESVYENYGDDVINATDLGGKYIAPIVVEDIPTDYECVEFVVSPYAVIDGVKYYSHTMTATIYSNN